MQNIEELSKLELSDLLSVVDPKSETEMGLVQSKLGGLVQTAFQDRDPNISFIDTEAFDKSSQKEIHEISPKGLSTLLEAVTQRAESVDPKKPKVILAANSKPTPNGWIGKLSDYEEYTTVLLAPAAGSKLRRGFIVNMKYQRPAANLWAKNGHEYDQATNITELKKASETLRFRKNHRVDDLPTEASITFFQLPFKE